MYKNHRTATWRTFAMRVLVSGAAVMLVASCASASESDSTGVGAAAEDVAGAVDTAADAAEQGSAEIADVLLDNGLSSVASAVEMIDFTELTDSPEFTFFAPNDEAFQILEASEAADLLADVDALADVLRNHIIAERVVVADLVDGDVLKTEAGHDLAVVVQGDTVTIGGATITQADIDVAGGVVHVVDQLLVP